MTCIDRSFTLDWLRSSLGSVSKARVVGDIPFYLFLAISLQRGWGLSIGSSSLVLGVFCFDYFIRGVKALSLSIVIFLTLVQVLFLVNRLLFSRTSSYRGVGFFLKRICSGRVVGSIFKQEGIFSDFKGRLEGLVTFSPSSSVSVSEVMIRFSGRSKITSISLFITEVAIIVLSVKLKRISS